MLGRLSFARQMLVLQIAVMLVVVAIATVVYAVIADQSNRRSAEVTALAIARSTAEIPELRETVATESGLSTPTDAATLAVGTTQRVAEQVRLRTAALFVVVTDDAGRRLAHPQPTEVGRQVSTDPSEALAGRESTGWATGTLGESARAKVPVYAPGSTDAVVGEVSVGFAGARVVDTLRDDIPGLAVVAVLALLVGIGASVLLSRRLRRQTLGLQPSELAGLVQDQTAVLGGIGEGVLGIAPDGHVTVCNERAARLLQLHDPVGRNVSSLELPDELRRAMARGVDHGAAEASEKLRLAVHDRLLFSDVGRVVIDGQDLGQVVVLRDETDLESMAQRLTAVSAMSTALRVQRHEFANRLHVISGLLATDRPAEARSYLAGVLDHGPVNYPLGGADLVTEPYLQAFLGAKALDASERGVALRVGDATLVRGALERPEEATAVIGNLLDNAITAAVLGSRIPRTVEIELLDDASDLHVVIADSGDGVDPARVDLWSVEPTSGTDDPAREHGLGFGLPLSRGIARRDGGDVWIADAGGPASGAVFCARLVGVIRAPTAVGAPESAS